MSSLPTSPTAAALLTVGALLLPGGASAGPVSIVSYATLGRSGAQTEGVIRSQTNTAMAALGGSLYFRSGGALWKTDGTPGGTRPTGVRPSGSATAVVATRNALYFPTDEGLYRSDGTPAGTTLVQQASLPAESYSAFASAGSRLLFERYENGGRSSIFGTDGTPGGTAVLDLYEPRRTSGYGAAFTQRGDVVYISGGSGFRLGLRQSDGTPAGTKDVGDVAAKGLSVGTYSGTARDGSVYGIAGNLVVRAATPGATPFVVSDVPVANVVSDGSVRTGGGAPNRPFDALVPFGDSMLFRDPTGTTLWITDGTRDGTKILSRAGNHDGTPLGVRTISDLTVVGAAAYFVVFDPVHGREPWVTDGTAEGTRLVEDLVPGEGSSDPSSLSVVGQRLLFAANGTDGQRRLHGLDVDPTGYGPRRAAGSPAFDQSVPFVPAKITPTKLVVAAANLEDARAPYRWDLTVALILPLGTSRDVCRGKVALVVKRGPRAVVTRNASMAIEAGSCVYRTTVRVPKAALDRRGGELIAKARFAGTKTIGSITGVPAARLTYGEGPRE
ncbi:MAG: hypothetical protein Q7T55_10220 [Solirubrobacteraceae bacterium]|nr:hypothetical protein [Solirubrobacteraceae bacterium]